MTKPKTTKSKPTKPTTKSTKPTTEQPATTNQQPATTNQQPATTNQQTATKRTPPPEVEVRPSSCPRCGSESREGYHSTKVRAISGTTADGRPYKMVVWKRTKCRDCGLPRVDVHYLNREPRASDGERLDVVQGKSTKRHNPRG